MRAARGATTTLLLLYGTLILSYLDRAVFALSLKPIKAALTATDAQLGLLTGLAFAISYAVFAPVAGWFGDRFSRKAVLIVAIAVWSAATAATALATSFPLMFLARGVVGMGEAAVFPLALSILSDLHADSRGRHRAYMVFMTGSVVGNVIALLFGGTLVQSLPALAGLAPWQSVFLLASAAGLLMMVLIGTAMREPPRERRADVAPTDPARLSARRFLRGNAHLVVTLYIGFSFLQLGYSTSLGFIVLALGRLHGWSPGESGVSFALTAGPASFLGVFAVGWLIRKLRERDVEAAPLVVGVVYAAGFSLFSAAGLVTHGGPGSLALLSLGFFFALGAPACAFVVLGEAMPSHIRTQLAGLNTFAMAAICNTLGPYAVGLMSDRLFHGAGGIATALAVVNVAAAAIGGLIVMSGARAYAAQIVAAASARTRLGEAGRIA